MDGNNKISYSGVNWLLFFNIILYVVITELVIIVNSYISYNEPDTYLTRIIVQTFGILLPVILYSKSKGVDFADFYRVKPLSLKNCAVIIGLGVCWQFIGYILKFASTSLFGLFKVTYTVNTQKTPISTSPYELIPALLALVVLPAVAEELLFRGLVVRSYEKWGTKSAIAISAVFFSILHLDIINVVATLLMGILLAYVVVKTDSILSGVLLHFVNNLTATIIMLIISNTKNFRAEAIIFISAGAIVLFFFLLSRFGRMNIKSKYIPQKKTVAADLCKALFNLPMLLSIIAFIILQLRIFDVF